MKIENYINKEHDIFYIDLGDFNESYQDIKLEEGDLIRFDYEGQRYTGTITSIGSNKNGIYKIEIKKLSM